MHISDFSGTTLRLRYQLVRRIGYGGMATVYEATDLQIDKRVAVKVLNPQFSHIEDYIARFRQEALSAARIRHPQLVDVTDFGSDDGLVYFVMELLEGESLGERIHREPGPIAWQEVVAIVSQVCEALACAHQHGIIHRDVKPGNVFLVAQPGRSGLATVKLLDLGVAKVLRDALDLRDAAAPETRLSQGTPGTPEYMAPEQATGQPFDHRIDVYALGVMMYRMLTGHLPFFSPKSSFEVLRMHVDLKPISLHQLCPEAQIPGPIEEIVLRALAKRPEDRFDSVRALSDALQSQWQRPPGETPASVLVSRPREEPAPRYYEVEPPRALYLLRATSVLLSLVTAGVLTMLLMLFELPWVRDIVAVDPPSPPLPERQRGPWVISGVPDADVKKNRDVEHTITTPGPPPTLTPTPVTPPPPVTPPADPGHSPPTPPPGRRLETRYKTPGPNDTRGEPKPPETPEQQARRNLEAAARKIGKACRGGRGTEMTVKLAADFVKNTVVPTYTGQATDPSRCVIAKLKGLEPLKKPGKGSTTLTLVIKVPAAI
ncbi:serine/threonine-protein kinase [Nannocystis sp.]|uniref:serine/threonine-protein kinase n=1 Tax=Nannocystis sp. TaxID=1962667 RepID=UPI0025E35166|nr:serine/threonine-protein kinase [Nannocystis sp.]MBK7827192.1 serine/threonine protein kinase [Nannocystis sp.]